LMYPSCGCVSCGAAWGLGARRRGKARTTRTTGDTQSQHHNIYNIHIVCQTLERSDPLLSLCLVSVCALCVSMSLCGDTDPLGVAGAEWGCGRVMPASLPPAPKASSLDDGKRNDLHHTHRNKPLLQSVCHNRSYVKRKRARPHKRGKTWTLCVCALYIWCASLYVYVCADMCSVCALCGVLLCVSLT
jgi:hypothetical protein